MRTWQEFVEEKLEEASHGLPKDIEKARHQPGGSNVGKERKTSGGGPGGTYCGPSGGAPKGSYPINNEKQRNAAKAYAHNAPNPEGIARCADNVKL